MLSRYVFADLIRNPRRTLSTMVGVTLGVGLFCGVLFFIDGLSASMTQRAVAPLPIDMQRILTERPGGSLVLTQTIEPPKHLAAGAIGRVRLEIASRSDLAANEVTLRSLPRPGLRYVAGSAEIDGAPVGGFDDNPFAHGPARTGYNVGTVSPGGSHHASYMLRADVDVDVDNAASSSYSTRESVKPIAANQPPPVLLTELARQIGRLDGVADATQLSIAELEANSLSVGGAVAAGPTKIFGFDADYVHRDPSIHLVAGALTVDGAVVSVEAARAIHVGVGGIVSVRLPDNSSLKLRVAGTADLTGSRSLFSSRRGGDLETFIYTRNSVVVSSELFARSVHPAFERVASGAVSRLKTPPIREIDVTLKRGRLNADPSTALGETRRIASQVNGVAAFQDYLLDNISNTLEVAAADAGVAKRLFVFLGVPGGLLAAMLAAYAGNVLAEAQRREQATLRIRGASRRHLLWMLALRTALLTAAGAAFGLVAGYLVAAVILGRQSLTRASTSSLVTSAVIGAIGGFAATGAALYVTGRRSIDREINEDRARLAVRPPLWRRARLDMIGTAVVVAGTVLALRSHAFNGASGSVYFGRSVHLNLALLVLPLAVWMTASLFAARVIGYALARSRPASSPTIARIGRSLWWRSVGRRPWAITNGAVVVSLIVALATSLAAFTSSYDGAKRADARYANGADIRITPGPTAARTYTANDAHVFETGGVARATPVIYGLKNVILRSARTSDPTNVAAVDPKTYLQVAPLSGDSAAAVRALEKTPNDIVLSRDMAAFLKAKPGDTLHVLLARATDQQVETDMRIVGLYERLPGFPDGADAVMTISQYSAHVPTKAPDFFLADTGHTSDAALRRAVTALRNGPAANDHLRIDTRATALNRDQSSLAALNIAGLVNLDTTFALTMAAAAVAIFVFGLLLSRRREYVTLRAQGLQARRIRLLIAAEAATVAVGGTIAGLVVGAAMGFYFVAVLRPLFVLSPVYSLPLRILGPPVALVFAATALSTVAGSRLVNKLQPTELLRDE